MLVGWVMWLIMINPFWLLAHQARAINAQSTPDEVQVRGVWEAVEIAEAVEGMLARIGDEQERTKAALESARDFAAAASHELRTPLTAMRTNLEVLATLDMTDDQRAELIGDVIRTQSRIEATLSAERLAQGQLMTAADHVPVDSPTPRPGRPRRGAELSGTGGLAGPDGDGVILGLPAGLRLVVDNAIANAVKHGKATEIRLSALNSGETGRSPSTTTAPVCPRRNARGVRRFSRGSTASRAGSGLGLALVAQQAELHGGTASLEISPMGGARLVLRLPGVAESNPRNPPRGHVTALTFAVAWPSHAGEVPHARGRIHRRCRFTDPETYLHGMPYEVFAALRPTRPGRLAPVRRHRVLGADRLRRDLRRLA